MIKVERYYCEHCKRYFKTPSRHFCFRDPENRACGSCVWWQGYQHPLGSSPEAVCGFIKGSFASVLEPAEGYGRIEFGAYHRGKGYLCPHWKLWK